MFALDTAIDAVQTGKKEFVKTFVKNDAVSKALVAFVDAQTTYTKSLVKAGTDTVTVAASEATKAAQEAAKYDYSKLGDSFKTAFEAFVPKSKK